MLNDDSNVSGLCGSEVNPIENTDISDFSDNKSSDSNDTINDSSAYSLLKDIKLKNINRITIGSLNINSISSKFDQLREIIGKNLDIFTIQETKLDGSFPKDQFLIEGYSEPYRLDRNREGGYLRKDIPSKPLTKHNFTKGVEGMFVEINLRKTKLLLFCAYRSEHEEYGLVDIEFFEQVGLALDVYSNYDKFLLAGDFNTKDEDQASSGFSL